MKRSWSSEGFETSFIVTDDYRTLIEYRDLDGATWYRLAPGESPGPQIVETRLLRQRRIEQRRPDGHDSSYWEPAPMD